MKRLLFKIAKSPRMGKMVGLAFQHCSPMIPVKKLLNSKEILVFRHPRPSYENHIILSPKRVIKNLQQLSQDDFCRYFVKLLEMAKELGATHPKYRDSYVLVANGGKRQEVQQVHFHMFTKLNTVNEYAMQEPVQDVFYCDEEICVLKHPNPNWEVHFVAAPVRSFQTTEHKEHEAAYLKGVLQSIDLLNVEFDIVQRGYSLVYRQDNPVFHIVSGRKLG